MEPLIAMNGNTDMPPTDVDAPWINQQHPTQCMILPACSRVNKTLNNHFNHLTLGASYFGLRAERWRLGWGLRQPLPEGACVEAFCSREEEIYEQGGRKKKITQTIPLLDCCFNFHRSKKKEKRCQNAATCVFSVSCQCMRKLG